MTKIAIIGSGFSGLSAACYLSKAGHEVHIYEKNSTIGGRARQIKTESGYVFDMGPSWYWMPDVFEKFYNDFGYTAADFYELILLSPAFNIVFPQSELLTIPSNFEEICELFESLEKGSSLKLQAFMNDAQYKYDVGMKKLVYKPGLSLTEFLDIELIKGVFKLEVFTSFSKHVRSYFKHPKLIALMEFPVLFLGAMPKDTPALYSLMNYAGLKLGTWYPIGGFGTVIDAMAKIAIENKVKIYTNSPVEKINSQKKVVSGIKVNGENLEYDYVISSADYNHTEKQLLSSNERNYSDNYWTKKVFAPSCLIYYIGLNKRVKNLEHHTLFFEEDLDQHAVEIYKQPEWPSKPLFYVCCPSKTDNTVAPAGHENLFLLMPIAPDLEDTEEVREQYFKVMMARLEKQIGEPLMEHIDYKKSYCVEDFKLDYNSFKGNAYGLANTLMQTANLKPSIKSKKIENLYYVGQLTVPGPGVPPSIISGKIAAELILNKTN
ncbi:phytoene desaturase family protein [Pedobacter flavus]|uniref:Oleate hydratase n=1 Tax=Pedobacter flavus TaxID=3113906 RepID=A0ABU7H316_9SPHI|nr:oleate hydratase [Pedobacter sp. VNH31]MEE1885732.1 oleate hydratase [Pedobacter sp. VNH31]